MSEYFRAVDRSKRQRRSKKYKYTHIVLNPFTQKEWEYQSNFKWDEIPNNVNVKLFGRYIRTEEALGE